MSLLLIGLLAFVLGLLAGLALATLMAKAKAASDAGLSDRFKALAADVMRANNESFLQLAESRLKQSEQSAAATLNQKSTAIDELMKPVRESLAKVDGQLQALETKREGAYRELIESVRQSHESNRLLRGETSQLLQALRNPNVRGHWGEVQLKRILEMVGMSAYARDFSAQQNFAGEDGMLRPDMIVNLPGAGCLILDSKVPLSSYLDAVQSIDTVIQQEMFKLYARHVRAHVKTLGSKAYWQQVEGSPELVVMFLPGDHFLGAALQDDPDLLEYSALQNVIIATPMTLIGLLRAVASNWKQEDLRKNVLQIGKLGSELYGALSTMTDHLTGLGGKLAACVDTYNKFLGSYDNNVLNKARRLREFGASKEGKMLVEQVEPIEKLVRQINSVEPPPGQDAA